MRSDGEHLGLVPPWRATDFWSEPNTRGELDDHLRAEVPSWNDLPCPRCGRMCQIRDRIQERIWRRPDCGVRRTEMPCARPHSHFTFGMESMVVALCRARSIVDGMDLSRVTAVGVDGKCFSDHDAYSITFAARDSIPVGPEIHGSPSNGYLYHYHVFNRATPAHVFFSVWR